MGCTRRCTSWKWHILLYRNCRGGAPCWGDWCTACEACSWRGGGGLTPSIEIQFLIFFLMWWLIKSALIPANTWIFFLIRRKQRQKSRRRRKMEIRKRQKWRPKASPSPFTALSYQPGQHCAVELVLSVILRNSPFGLLPCFHIALESFKKVAMHPFLWNVIYWSLKWAFFYLY